MKSSFLKLYTLPFVANKKRELNINFDESESLRSFFERKLSSLSRFTTLPFINQVEIAMNDLPSEVSSLLILEGKMTGDKTEILDYCDSIQNLVEHVCKSTERSNESDREPNQQSDQMRMEIFNFVPEDETSEVEQMLTDSPESDNVRGGVGGKVRGNASGGTVRGVATGGFKKRGRPKKNTIPAKKLKLKT